MVVVKELQLGIILDKIELLLKWRPASLKVLVFPMVIFIGNCCSEHTRDDMEVNGERMLKELNGLRRTVRSFLMKKRISNV